MEKEYIAGEPQRYEIGGRVFIVEPRYRKDGESMADILLNLCTGAMIVAIIICAGIRSTGLDTAFFAASSFLAYALLIIGMALLLYLSYRASLSIFRKRRHARSKVAPND